MTHPEEQMVSRLTPAVLPDEAANVAAGRELGFLIEIPASDGTILLRMSERHGRLVVEGDESRWDEGARRFVHMMMQWSGVVGIRWKDEAVREAAR